MTTILVVDDSPLDRRLAGSLLSKAGDWTVIFAEDGEQGWRTAADMNPDLVVTDLQMPGQSGLDLVTVIRRESPQTPVVLMTGRGSEELAVEALRRGAAGYVPKRSLAQDLIPLARRILANPSETSPLLLFNRLQQRTERYLLENSLDTAIACASSLQQTISDAWDLPHPDRIRVATALEEALLNALYHGNLEMDSQLKEQPDGGQIYYQTALERMKQAPYCDRRIQIQFALTPVRAEVEIRDEGAGFDPATLPDPTDPDYLERPCGRGILLMRSFMDEVRFSDGGRQVTLVRHRYRDALPL
jgi:CheY-like chemotaxis protein/anti-sigma regulatory factor (Ser/Thr protein kinase)